MCIKGSFFKGRACTQLVPDSYREGMDPPVGIMINMDLYYAETEGLTYNN